MAWRFHPSIEPQTAESLKLIREKRPQTFLEKNELTVEMTQLCSFPRGYWCHFGCFHDTLLISVPLEFFDTVSDVQKLTNRIWFWPSNGEPIGWGGESLEHAIGGLLWRETGTSRRKAREGLTEMRVSHRSCKTFYKCTGYLHSV